MRRKGAKVYMKGQKVSSIYVIIEGSIVNSVYSSQMNYH